jgi:hypothetical protein
MRTKRFNQSVMLLFYLSLVLPAANAQSNNLLRNPAADEAVSYWQAVGDAFVEQLPAKGFHFRVRNKGSFRQDVLLPEGAQGKYVLLIGRVASERINPDDTITGLPYLYGYMMTGTNPRARDTRILSYLQGQQMLCSAKEVGEWVTAWGIFPVAPGTGVLSFFLNQAERKDVPQNGSVARFDDLGLYVFDTEVEANAFVKTYQEQH